MERKINYFLATWSGKRRTNHEGEHNFLVDHIAYLNKVQHQFSQVSIGYPENPKEAQKYTRYIRGLKALNDGTPIVVHKMENQGMSYGQYSHLFKIYRDQFTHFVLCEDDYVPVLNNFDVVLADMFDEFHESKNCGFLCGLLFNHSGRFGRKFPLHGAISNGITTNKVLNKVWNDHGCLPSGSDPHKAQIVFSQAFLKSGFTLQEYVNQYRSIFYGHGRSIRIYWNGEEDKDIFVPIPWLQHNKSYWTIQRLTEDS